MVYTQGPKGFPYTYFKAQVCTIQLHGPFGFLILVSRSRSRRTDTFMGMRRAWEGVGGWGPAV